ncbi:C45 family autoproteolytic acyltransferase/hydolase [Kineococcus arenarius]|uniref:C45 family autoproteolytic acyltransferase/hydolase n=1 Tax=unclassified Kineococcus TaxID=2621656 RepID=UPI003D7C561A
MTVHRWEHGADAVLDARPLGAWAAPQLRRALAEYDGLFAALGVPAAVAVEVAQDCLAALREWAPDLAGEVVELAAGAGVPVGRVALLAARTEVLTAAPVALPGECSTAVHVPADGGPPRTVQTWDWNDDLASDVLVRTLRRPGGPRVATFCEFGQPAKIGVNDAGLGVHFNILRHRSDGGRGAVPVHALARRVLDTAGSVPEAVGVVRSAAVSASTVLTVVDRTSAAFVEVSPAGVAVLPVPRGSTGVHTNHFLDPALAAGEATELLDSSRARLDALTARADAVAEPGARERVVALAGCDAGGCLAVRPRTGAPLLQRWATKSTIALDLVGGRLQFGEGGPAEAAEAWQEFPVPGRPGERRVAGHRRRAGAER